MSTSEPPTLTDLKVGIEKNNQLLIVILATQIFMPITVSIFMIIVSLPYALFITGFIMILSLLIGSIFIGLLRSQIT